MTFEQDVSTLRANANHDRVTQIQQACPAPDEIEPWHHLDALLWPDLSENDDSRCQQIPAAMDELQDELRRYIGRYDDLRQRGLDAMSNYDLGIAYRVSGPESGLASTLLAIANHIGRTRAQLLWLLGEQVRLTPPQLALF